MNDSSTNKQPGWREPYRVLPGQNEDRDLKALPDIDS